VPFENLTTSAGASPGVAFLVSAGIMAEIVAKACSSPQTVEINAHTRAETLMKWVNVGLIEGAALVIYAAVIDPGNRAPILMGAIFEGVITLVEYVHAKRSGLASAAPATEQHLAPVPSYRG
jgi:hypothetical protein